MRKVDVCFALAGRAVPRDHGYALYAALSRHEPHLHKARWLGVMPISGTPVGDRLHLPARPELRLRVPVAQIRTLLPLVGATLDVAGCPLMVGAPTIRSLVPSASLDARLVTIKVTSLPRRFSPDAGRDVIDAKQLESRFRAEADRQVAKLGITGCIELTGRRRLQVGGRFVVGFSVRVSGLSDADSIRLQEEGLGGKRAMGCGLFRPTRGGG